MSFLLADGYGFHDLRQQRKETRVQSGPLDTYGRRLNIIEDALYERLDRLIDRDNA
ncbi:MAG: hypothetical protein LBK67_07025 [Coriobacteriales bacterium]|jgi:hypothetical protein|nr:hypothetical protein [Coriobacteriales bacterium]